MSKISSTLILAIIMLPFAISCAAQPKRLPPPLLAFDGQEGTIIDVTAGDLEGDGIAEIVIIDSEGSSELPQQYLNIWKWDGTHFVRRLRKSADEIFGDDSLYLFHTAIGKFDGRKKELILQEANILLCLSWSGSQYVEKWRRHVGDLVKGGLTGPLQGVADIYHNGQDDITILDLERHTVYVLGMQNGTFTLLWQSPQEYKDAGTANSLIPWPMQAGGQAQGLVSLSRVGQSSWYLYGLAPSSVATTRKFDGDVSKVGFYLNPVFAGDLDGNGDNEILALGTNVFGKG